MVKYNVPPCIFIRKWKGTYSVCTILNRGFFQYTSQWQQQDSANSIYSIPLNTELDEEWDYYSRLLEDWNYGKIVVARNISSEERSCFLQLYVKYKR